jgi:hypothetical protein
MIYISEKLDAINASFINKYTKTDVLPNLLATTNKNEKYEEINKIK